MDDIIKSNIVFEVTGLFLIKYSFQTYYSRLSRNQITIEKEKPYVPSTFIWLIALIVFSCFILKRNSLDHHFVGLIILLIGIVIGTWGLLNLRNNYHEDLNYYENGTLVSTGIYSFIRHPIRLGICLEVLALSLFVNSVLLYFLVVFYFYLNYMRTIKEDKFLTKIYNSEATKYFSEVPRFNLIKSIFLKLKLRI